MHRNFDGLRKLSQLPNSEEISQTAHTFYMHSLLLKSGSCMRQPQGFASDSSVWGGSPHEFLTQITCCGLFFCGYPQIRENRDANVLVYAVIKMNSLNTVNS